MRGKKTTPKLPTDINIKTSTANFFINTIIVLLAVIIIFLTFSLVTKLKDSDGEAAEINREKAADIVQIQVLNGCGASGIADRITDYLRRNNFDVVETGNYISFDVNNTLVIDRIGNKANAEKVAEALGIDKKHVIQQINNDYFLDVSLIIGKDFNQLKAIN